VSLALVRIAALDLRTRSDHRAELASQLLLGELVRVSSASPDRQWRRVRSEEDGYGGWVRTWGLCATTPAEARRWRSRGVRVRTLFTEALDRPGRGARVAPLTWNARVLPLGTRGRFTRVRIPGGAVGWVRTTDLRSGEETVTLASRARTLLGAPYLWGGRTPAGLDCSSLTQLMLLDRGIQAPRDARDQQLWATPLDGSLRAGDLVFFGRTRKAGHVGLVLSGRSYLHCRGTVQVASLDPRSPVYDRELGRQYLGAGRPPA